MFKEWCSIYSHGNIDVLCHFTLSGKAQSKNVQVDLDATRVNQLKAELLENGVWQLETEGVDSWIVTVPLKEALDAKATVLAFDYFCPKGLDQVQIYFNHYLRLQNKLKDKI